MKFSKFTFVLFVITVFNGLSVSAKIVKDTLITSDGDRIIVTYDIVHSGNQYTIRFNNQSKKLGQINKDKYKDNLDKVAVMFFDRTGRFSNEVTITDMVPEAFMVPSNVNYEHSLDGFYIVQDNPTLTFTTSERTEINIPLYLAYHPKKGKYSLFSKCKGMKVKLSSSSSDSAKQSGSTQTTQQTITSTTDIESDNANVLRVLESIGLAKELLDEADKLPFSETLQDEIRFIREQKREVTDPDFISQISDILKLYDDTKKCLEEKALDEQRAKQEEAENRAKLEQAKNDSIRDAQQAEATKEKKRNFWMIVGGFIFAILAFIGNQVFQSFRNSRNQRNMMNMQESIAKKAEAEAKRRARNAIRNTTNRRINQVKSGIKESVRKKTTIMVNGKTKNSSI